MTTRRTSEFGYYVRGQPRETTGQGPTSAGRARAVANNLDHLQDEANQHAANVCAALSSNWTQAATTVGTYSQLDKFAAIPVLPLRREPDGSSNRLVVTVSARCSIVSAFKATLLVTMRPLRAGSPLYTPITGVSETATVTLSSSATVTSVVTIYVSHLGDSWLLPGTIGRDGAGALASVRMYAAQVEVWATSEDAAVHPVMEALTVRGWVG